MGIDVTFTDFTNLDKLKKELKNNTKVSDIFT